MNEQRLRNLIETLYDSIHRGVGRFASADDSELAELINDTMSELYGAQWHTTREEPAR